MGHFPVAISNTA